MALELSTEKGWIRRAGRGHKPYEKAIAPDDQATLLPLTKRAKPTLGLAEDARAVSCCDVNRDAF